MDHLPILVQNVTEPSRFSNTLRKAIVDYKIIKQFMT